MFRRVFLYALLAIFSSTLLSSIYPTVTSNTIIESSWATTTTGVSVYWDSACTSEVSAIDWNTIEAGSSETRTVYIKNTDDTNTTLFLDTDNWNPPEASQHITLTWDYGGESISPGAVVEVTLTLNVSQTLRG